MAEMKEVRCKGTIKNGRLAGKPCGKFLGLLSEPYKDVICGRCGHKNNSEDQTKESVTENDQHRTEA